MAESQLTTSKAGNFVAEPLSKMGKVTDLPAIGPAAAKVLATIGIENSKQLFGLYLQFNDPDDFIDFLEGKGMKFGATPKLPDPKSELKNTLAAKWEVVKNY